MKYYKVTAKGCEPSTFAISEKTGKVFVHNDEIGGAFLHTKNAKEMADFLKDPGLTVKKSFGAIFKSLNNWWSLEDAKDFVECLMAETA